MKTKEVPFSWITRLGHRLDVEPYLSGAVETRVRLELASYPKEPLLSLTTGPEGGIYKGPMFHRTYVDSPEHGVPFVGSSAMLRAELSDLPYLSRKYTETPKMTVLRLQRGMTLISRSGTIGRTVYVRPDMEGILSSEHIMKVVPDSTKIRSGYLFAFLSSKFGISMVTSGTYGAIIQHIEPEHIADIPVPRLGDKVEQRAHDLMEKAATQLTDYRQLLERATKELLSAINIEDITDEDWLADDSCLGWTQKGFKWGTFRAFNYDPRAEAFWSRLSKMEHSNLGDLCDPAHFKGHIVFKRMDCDPEFGRLLVGQRHAFQLHPDGRWISSKSIEGLGLVVPKGTVLITSHGTLGEQELYCRAVIVTERTSQYAFSGDFYRCIPKPNAISGYYLFAFLRSHIAFRMLRGMSTGGKQQYQHPAMLYQMPIPRLQENEEEQIAAFVQRAVEMYDSALNCEDEAVALVEQAIEETV